MRALTGNIGGNNFRILAGFFCKVLREILVNAFICAVFVLVNIGNLGLLAGFV